LATYTHDSPANGTPLVSNGMARQAHSSRAVARVSFQRQESFGRMRTAGQTKVPSTQSRTQKAMPYKAPDTSRALPDALSRTVGRTPESGLVARSSFTMSRPTRTHSPPGQIRVLARGHTAQGDLRQQQALRRSRRSTGSSAPSDHRTRRSPTVTTAGASRAGPGDPPSASCVRPRSPTWRRKGQGVGRCQVGVAGPGAALTSGSGR